MNDQPVVEAQRVRTAHDLDKGQGVMTTREAYELAYRLVRLEMSGKVDQATAAVLLDQLPQRAVIAAWRSRGDMPTGITYKWLSFERMLAFSSWRIEWALRQMSRAQVGETGVAA